MNNFYDIEPSFYSNDNSALNLSTFDMTVIVRDFSPEGRQVISSNAHFQKNIGKKALVKSLLNNNLICNEQDSELILLKRAYTLEFFTKDGHAIDFPSMVQAIQKMDITANYNRFMAHFMQEIKPLDDGQQQLLSHHTRQWAQQNPGVFLTLISAGNIHPMAFPATEPRDFQASLHCHQAQLACLWSKLDNYLSLWDLAYGSYKRNNRTLKF